MLQEACQEIVTAEPRECLATGCSRETKRPFCKRHWLLIPSRMRNRMDQLEDEGATLAFELCAAIAASRCDDNAPIWRRGGPRPTTQQATVMDTFDRVRGDLMFRHRDRYHELTGVHTETLEELAEQIDLPGLTALEVALAMVRNGLGTEGYDPTLIAAALDVDDAGGR